MIRELHLLDPETGRCSVCAKKLTKKDLSVETKFEYEFFTENGDYGVKKCLPDIFSMLFRAYISLICAKLIKLIRGN